MQGSDDTLPKSNPAGNEDIIARSIYLIVVLVVCVATWGLVVDMPKNAGIENMASEPATLQSVLEQREKAVWESFKNKDKKALADLLADEYTGVFVDGQGEHDKRSAVEAMNHVTIRDYSLSDFKLSSLGTNAALLRYNASGNFSNAQGQEVKLEVANIWVKREERWQSVRCQVTETK